MRTFRDIALDESMLSQKEQQKLDILGQEVIQILGKSFAYKIDKFLGLQIYNDTPMLMGNYSSRDSIKKIIKDVEYNDKQRKSIKTQDLGNLDWSKQVSKDGHWTGD